MVSFGEAIKSFFVKAFDYKTRATRAEYWWVVLFTSILMTVTVVMSFILYLVFRSAVGFYIALILIGLASIAVFIPQISLSVRRLHDIGRTGKWLIIMYAFSAVQNILSLSSLSQLMTASSTVDLATSSDAEALAGQSLLGGLVSLIGLGIGIWFLVWFLFPSQPGVNKWGGSVASSASPYPTQGYGYTPGAPFNGYNAPLDYTATAAVQAQVPQGNPYAAPVAPQQPPMAPNYSYPPGHPLAGGQPLQGQDSPSAGYVRPTPVETPETAEYSQPGKEPEPPAPVFPREGFNPAPLNQNPFSN